MSVLLEEADELLMAVMLHAGQGRFFTTVSQVGKPLKNKVG